MSKKNTSAITPVHNEKYPVAMKIAKKFASTHQSRPSLTYVSHEADGKIVATDSHRLLRIRNIHGFKENYLVHLKTYEFATGPYPNTEDVIKKYRHKDNFKLTKEQIKMWHEMLKGIAAMQKALNNPLMEVCLRFEKDRVYLVAVEEKISMELPVTDYLQHKMTTIYCRSEYLRDALEAFVVLQRDELTFSFDGKLRPFILDAADEVRAVILPVRRYDDDKEDTESTTNKREED